MFSLLSAPCRGTEPLRAHTQTLFLAAIHAFTAAREPRLFEREPTPTVLLRRFDFGEFCIVSHETSAFSMFSTCLILLCFCPILIAFWRDLERKTRFLPAFPSHDRSPTFVLARRRRRKPRQAGATLAPQQTDAQPPEDKQKKRAGGRRNGRTAGARPPGIKTSAGRRHPIRTQDEDERWFLCAAVPWRYAGRRRGGVREADRGAVEDIGRRALLFV